MRAIVRHIDEKTSALRALESSGGSFVGYQVYFDGAAEVGLDPNLNPFFNYQANIFLESQVISDLIDSGAHQHADYFGVFSWKMKKKLNIDAAGIFNHMEQDGFRSDVYTFPFDFSGINVWYSDHPTTLRLSLAADRLLKTLGLAVPLTTFRSPVIFQNHFICRSAIYEAYQREMLKPCLEIMRSPADPELKRLLAMDSMYPVEIKLRESLRRIYGKPCYTLHPFIAERLFATWYGLKEAEQSYRLVKIPSRTGGMVPVGSLG